MNIYKVHLLDQSLVISLTVFQQGLAKEFSFKVNVTLEDIREYLLVSGAALHIDGVEFFKFCFPIMSDRRRAVPSLNSCQPLPTTMISQVFFQDHILFEGEENRGTVFSLHIIYSAWWCDSTNKRDEREEQLWDLQQQQVDLLSSCSLHQVLYFHIHILVHLLAGTSEDGRCTDVKYDQLAYSKWLLHF